MHVLITNDDGIDAEGLAAFEAAVARFARATVVAPRDEHSGGGHRVTVSRHLQVQRLGESRYAVDGTPADCVRLALIHLAPDVDWVLSGINQGGNLGVDLHMSGTVAAAREAAWMGKPGIAISQFRRSRAGADWLAASRMAESAIHDIFRRPRAPGNYWNVNLPDLQGEQFVPPMVDCPVERQHLHVDFEKCSQDRFLYRGSYQDRPRSPGSDVDICFSGRIAVSTLGGPQA